MATHDYVIDNQTAPSFRTDVNSALLAVVTQNSSATAPSTTYADMFWYDSANNQLKKRSEANSAWVTLGTIDEGLGTFTPSGGQLTIASQVEAEAGVDNTKVMTPLRTEQHMDANALGRSQTWQTLTGSRAGSTSYQNLTGRPIAVAINVGTTTTFFQASSNNVTFINLAQGQSTGFQNLGGIIPPNHYYRINGTPTINHWAELR